MTWLLAALLFTGTSWCAGWWMRHQDQTRPDKKPHVPVSNLAVRLGAHTIITECTFAYWRGRWTQRRRTGGART